MIVLLRTTIVTLGLAAVVLTGFWMVWDDHKQRQIEELTALNQQMEAMIAQREAMIGRLSRSRRVAHVEVLEQQMDEQGQVLRTKARFIELDDQGSELGQQFFEVPGDVIAVDALTVKFGHERVAEGHPLYGRTLILLRRLYSDRMPAIEGIHIDTPGAIPPGYATTEAGHFEKRLWETFWELATDADKAKAMGVRVAQGEVVYVERMRAGQTYELIVDNAGGMNLAILDTTPDEPGPGDDQPLSEAGGDGNEAE